MHFLCSPIQCIFPWSPGKCNSVLQSIGIEPQGPCKGATAQESLEAAVSVTVQQTTKPGLATGCPRVPAHVTYYIQNCIE